MAHVFSFKFPHSGKKEMYRMASKPPARFWRRTVSIRGDTDLWLSQNSAEIFAYNFKSCIFWRIGLRWLQRYFLWLQGSFVCLLNRGCKGVYVGGVGRRGCFGSDVVVCGWFVFKYTCQCWKPKGWSLHLRFCGPDCWTLLTFPGFLLLFSLLKQEHNAVPGSYRSHK